MQGPRRGEGKAYRPIMFTKDARRGGRGHFLTQDKRHDMIAKKKFSMERTERKKV